MYNLHLWLHNISKCIYKSISSIHIWLQRIFASAGPRSCVGWANICFPTNKDSQFEWRKSMEPPPQEADEEFAWPTPSVTWIGAHQQTNEAVMTTSDWVSSWQMKPGQHATQITDAVLGAENRFSRQSAPDECCFCHLIWAHWKIDIYRFKSVITLQATF